MADEVSLVVTAGQPVGDGVGDGGIAATGDTDGDGVGGAGTLGDADPAIGLLGGGVTPGPDTLRGAGVGEGVVIVVATPGEAVAVTVAVGLKSASGVPAIDGPPGGSVAGLAPTAGRTGPPLVVPACDSPL